MGKYDFYIGEINPDTTYGKLLLNIPENSFVLECGCATGYMTKFMHEKMGCNVHIVEIDPEACKKAAEYASDWKCGDLGEDGWREYYSQYKYDRIMFADVLEHLRNPMEVLEKASSLLKDDGRIIVSIPNICHNDILIRMYHDCFGYTPLGLLDDTHIHFWGVRDFAKGCQDIGLKAEKIEATCIPTGRTEQALPPNLVDEEVINLMKKREYGEVYQWIFTIKKDV